MRVKLGHLVEIKWQDSCDNDHWITLPEAREMTPAECVTCGILVYNGRERVNVFSSISDIKHVASVWSIPRGCIKSIRMIE
jgi:hypothetical protein